MARPAAYSFHLPRALTPQYLYSIYTLPLGYVRFVLFICWAFARADGITWASYRASSSNTAAYSYVYVALTLAASSSSTHGPRPSNKHAGWISGRSYKSMNYCVTFSVVHHKYNGRFRAEMHSCTLPGVICVFTLNGCHLTPIDEFAHISDLLTIIVLNYYFSVLTWTLINN